MTQLLFLPFRFLHPRRNVLVILRLFLTVGCLVTPSSPDAVSKPFRDRFRLTG